MSKAEKRYLFGIDLDGTLLAPRAELRPRTKAAVQAVTAAGHRVAFATGRNFIEAQKVFDAINHHDTAVLVSGAVVCDTRTGRWLHRSTMSPDLASELCGVIEATGHAAVAMVDRYEMGVDYLISEGREVHPSLNIWLALSGQRVEQRPALATADHSHTLRVSTVTTYAVAAEIRAAVEEKIGSRTYLHGIVVPEDSVEIVEMFDPEVNKWQGLTRVADLHGVDRDNIICIGDETNDLPMIRHAPLGVAMGNARQEIKDVANLVIGSNVDDGLAEFLEQWLLDPASFDVREARPRR